MSDSHMPPCTKCGKPMTWGGYFIGTECKPCDLRWLIVFPAIKGHLRLEPLEKFGMYESMN